MADAICVFHRAGRMPFLSFRPVPLVIRNNFDGLQFKSHSIDFIIDIEVNTVTGDGRDNS